jgi:predicted nucleic acid-binding protein
VIAPLDLAVSRAVARIPRDQVPDLPDGVIAAAALVRRLPLVTRDGKIRASGIETIW